MQAPVHPRPAPRPAPSVDPLGSSVAAAAPPSPGVVDPSIMIPVYVLVMTVGFFVFQGGWATLHGNEMSRQQALFTAVNAATCTGFQQARTVSEYTAAGQITTFILMLSGLLFSWIVGGAAVVRIAKLPWSIRRLTLGALGLIAATAGVGAIVGQNRYGAAWPGIYQGVAALANCGLYLRRPPAAQDWQAMLLLLPVVLGGLGLPVLFEAVTRLHPRRSIPPSKHFNAAISWSGGVYLCGTAALLLSLWLGASTSWHESWRDWLSTASTEAINARSAGLPLQAVGEWPRSTQWVVIGLMLVGTCSAGAGGGMKVTTLAVVCRGMRDSLAGRVTGKLFGIASVWAILFLGLCLVATLVLLTTEPQMPADRLLFLAASAIGNIGLSHDPVVVSNAGLYTLAITMLAGRVLPVLVLWTVADERTEEARVGIG